MPLKKYRQKRNFKKTTEPFGKKTKRKGSALFVVQKHAAKHLHYDLRLEIEGVLKSWAVPKGPSLDPKVKRLAVQVEDHPLEYGSFEGIIPKGEYGGGTVMLWDMGSWESADPKKAYQQGDLTFILHGKKLRGAWKLIRIKNDPENWLLIKINDTEAQTGHDITKEQPLSVASGKSLDEISKMPPLKVKAQKKSEGAGEFQDLKKLIKKLGLKKVPLPNAVKPALATLVDTVPQGENWLHELKYDGYRIISTLDKTITMSTRNQVDWTNKFPKISNELKRLGLSKTIMDGEIVAIDKQLRPNFQMLQNSVNKKQDDNLFYYVFDLLFYDGYDLRHLALIQRKEILKIILSSEPSASIIYGDHIIGEGDAIFKEAGNMHYEGIVSKEIHSAYSGKRTKQWLKIKCTQRQEFIICGFTKPKGNRQHFGSLILGYYCNKKLTYAGHVGTGFDSHLLKEISVLLKQNQSSTCPFHEDIHEPNLAAWTVPKIVVEVEFTEMTKEGILRHPTFKGLREDKSPHLISLETPNPIPIVSKSKPSTIIANVKLTHPEKILYPEDNITKIELANYYHKIADFILPLIVNRPLSFLRCPQGVQGKCFYQKHLQKTDDNAHLYTSDNGIFIKNTQGLIQIVQLDVLEIHPWCAKIDNIEKPDMLIFDLDPGQDVVFKDVVEAALLIKSELENYDLTAFVKSTGKKGLHIVVPIQRRYEWHSTFEFSKLFAYYLAKKYPDLFVRTVTKSKRSGKIFIDYLRNHRGATAIAPFSTRVNHHATIALPIPWESLSSPLLPNDYTISNIDAYLAKTPHPWQDFYQLKQKLPRAK